MVFQEDFSKDEGRQSGLVGSELDSRPKDCEKENIGSRIEHTKKNI